MRVGQSSRFRRSTPEAGGARSDYTLEQHADFLATKKSLNDFLFLSRHGLLTTLAQNDEPKTA